MEMQIGGHSEERSRYHSNIKGLGRKGKRTGSKGRKNRVTRYCYQGILANERSCHGAETGGVKNKIRDWKTLSIVHRKETIYYGTSQK
jgi:hypothetical protein